jgi:hypothetical protein
MAKAASEARLTVASEILEILAQAEQWLSQPKVLSTTHSLGKTSKPLA